MKKSILFFEVVGTVAILVAMKLMISGVFAVMNANVASLLG